MKVSKHVHKNKIIRETAFLGSARRGKLLTQSYPDSVKVKGDGKSRSLKGWYLKAIYVW